MAEVAGAITSGAVENLVTQFSNAFDCFRELAQNSIDAGSPVVDVWTEFQVAEGHVGAACLHVDDCGEGMDERIVDEELTCLFASSKEGDLTKIGKFGIGFVSVFALKPGAVLVHTGRGGEYWEVMFHEDRSFTKTRLDAPVEGTKVTLFVEADYVRYRELVDGARGALRKWCCHAETRVTFEDRSPPAGQARQVETINEPFTVPGDCLTRVDVPGTEIVLAYNKAPIYGLYNRGLALAVTTVADAVFETGRARRYRHIALKISSRYLEHTLSRETVMRDESYEKAMGMLDAAASGPLLDRLLAEVDALVRRPELDLAAVNRYALLLSHLGAEPDGTLERLEERPLLRAVHGGALRLSDAWDAFQRDGRILVAEQPTEFARRVLADGSPIFLGRVPEGGEVDLEAGHPLEVVPVLLGRYVTLRHRRTLKVRVRRLVEDVFRLDPRPDVQAVVATPEAAYLPVTLDAAVPGEVRGLVEGAARLLRGVKARYRKLGTCVPAAATADVPFFVTGGRLGPVMGRPPRGIPDRKRKLEAAVNREHPHFERLARLHRRAPALACYCLAKSLLLCDDRMLERDAELMRAALGE